MRIQRESFDDIVFENRNRDYGAYELRIHYSKRGTFALAISMFIIFSAAGWPLISSILKKNLNFRYVEKNSLVVMANLEKEKPEIPPPPPPPPTKTIQDIKFVAPKIVDTLTNEEVELASTEELSESANAGTIDTTIHEDVIFKPEQEQMVEVPLESYSVQELPAYPGGESAMLKYVVEHTTYPLMALENRIEGTVYVRFVVKKTGEIGQTVVLRSVDQLLDEEAVRVVKTFPKWSPGKNSGNPVNVWIIIPVKFVLQK